MAAHNAVIRWLDPGSTELETIAQWRYDAFLKSYGLTLDDSRGHLVRLAARPPGEAALVAYANGVPVGVCLLVREELDAPHDRSPWLASLFVTESQRHQGIGKLLITTLEETARSMGYDRIYLYTDTAETLYLACGWEVEERFMWDGFPSTLMGRAL